MSRAMYFDKGSKRRVRQIRWRRLELATAILFALGATILSIYLALWMSTHPFD
jgi:hypothetical protein